MIEEDEPACDVTGDCEPFEEEAEQRVAMCRYCGGTRYKDHPFSGNWGVWQFGEPEPGL